ncbi:MAG TPA: hypothetical protein VMG99_00580 [Thermoplasmata archaeon]|jgi:hypothetical protein|nr:hypothetical protein [Thermoplasmata archaeon]
MLGYVIPPKRKDDGASDQLAIPADIRRRLATWIDVDELGLEGFWLWLRAVLPLLPSASPMPPPASPSGFRREENGEMHRRVVEYARDRARLAVICEEYGREIHVLARRVRALEGALRTFQMAGHEIRLPADNEAATLTDRYAPKRRERQHPAASAPRAVPEEPAPEAGRERRR